MFKIEKNVPMRPAKRSTYPFSDMEVGDSFAVDDPEGKGSQHNVAMYAHAWAKQSSDGWKFSARKQDDGTVRIWRIA